MHFIFLIECFVGGYSVETYITQYRNMMAKMAESNLLRDAWIWFNNWS